MLIFNLTASGSAIGSFVIAMALTAPFGITAPRATVPVFLAAVLSLDLYIRMQEGTDGLFTRKVGGHVWFIPLWLVSALGFAGWIASFFIKLQVN